MKKKNTRWVEQQKSVCIRPNGYKIYIKRVVNSFIAVCEFLLLFTNIHCSHFMREGNKVFYDLRSTRVPSRGKYSNSNTSQNK